MILYPAIDVQAGRCVRLRAGHLTSATIFNDDPLDQARRFAAMGFTHLHVVDLDGAVAGKSVNDVPVAAIARANLTSIQLGGGIRSRTDISGWLDRGVDRVILGTSAIRTPDMVTWAGAEYGERILVGIDVRDGRVAIEGWTFSTDRPARDLAREVEDSGIGGLIVTDIGRDGMKSGVNTDLVADLAEAVSIPVIASGGIGSIADIHRLAALGDDLVAGAIIGRALYDGDIDPAEAIAAAKGIRAC